VTPEEHLILLKNIQTILRTLPGLTPMEKRKAIGRVVGEIEVILVHHKKMTAALVGQGEGRLKSDA